MALSIQTLITDIFICVSIYRLQSYPSFPPLYSKLLLCELVNLLNILYSVLNTRTISLICGTAKRTLFDKTDETSACALNTITGHPIKRSEKNISGWHFSVKLPNALFYYRRQIAAVVKKVNNTAYAAICLFLGKQSYRNYMIAILRLISENSSPGNQINTLQ